MTHKSDSATTSASKFRHAVLAAQRSSHRVLADMIKPLGLTPAWAEVLSVLKENGPLSIRELSHFIVCEADHPSRLIKRMETNGLLTRAQDPDDKRAFKISLTLEGDAAAIKVAEIEAGFDQWILHRLENNALADATQTLERLLKGTPEARSLKNRYPDT